VTALTLAEIERALARLEQKAHEPPAVAMREDGWLLLRDILVLLGAENVRRALRLLGQAHPPFRQAIQQQRFPHTRNIYNAIHKDNLHLLREALMKAPRALGSRPLPLSPVPPQPKKRKGPTLVTTLPPSPPRRPLQYGIAPFGWAWADHHVPIPDEAEVLRWIRKELRFGSTCKEVADTLNAQERLNRGRKWTAEELEEALDRDDDIRERVKNRK
jgi:hypothetical protein